MKTVLIRGVAVVNVLLMLPFFVLTYGIDLFGSSGRTQALSVSNIAGIGALFRSQGIATDNETLFFSSKTTLLRTELDGKTFVAANLSAIPDELANEYGIAHIGGMSYYNGKLYAGLEDSKVWDYPIVGVFNPDTLELEDYYILDSTVITRGLPWVAVNPDNGLLYCTDHSKEPTKILMFDTNNDMAPAGCVDLAEKIPSIQGGEFCGGTLYLATNDETKAIYSLNVATGVSEKVIDRSLASGGEGEGMTIVYEDGKPVIYAIDLGLLFINTFIRRYAV